MNTTWKPQTKKPSASSQNPECAASSAQRFAEVARGPAAATGDPSSARPAARSAPPAGPAGCAGRGPAQPADQAEGTGSMANWPKELSALERYSYRHAAARRHRQADAARRGSPRTRCRKGPGRSAGRRPATARWPTARVLIRTRPRAYSRPHQHRPRRAVGGRRKRPGERLVPTRFCKAMAKAKIGSPSRSRRLHRRREQAGFMAKHAEGQGEDQSGQQIQEGGTRAVVTYGYIPALS